MGPEGPSLESTARTVRSASTKPSRSPSSSAETAAGTSAGQAMRRYVMAPARQRGVQAGGHIQRYSARQREESALR